MERRTQVMSNSKTPQTLKPITLILIRHGYAMDRDKFAAISKNDEQRPLTKKGIKLLNEFKKNKRKFLKDVELVYCSPLTRTVQTAKILWSGSATVKVKFTEALKPEAELNETKSYLNKITTKSKSKKIIAIVGHEPNLSIIANDLLFDNVHGAKKTQLPFKFYKGSAMILQLNTHQLNSGSAHLVGYINHKTDF